jgi:hypothetical protein
MRLTSSFNEFLTNTVNLNKARLDKLETSVEAIYTALRGDDQIGQLLQSKIPQGSWAHRTIIKPKQGHEFDADVLLRFSEASAWDDDPRAYRDAVYDAVGRHGTYGLMPHERKCRCVRVSYAGDFHVDLVPYVVHADGAQTIVNADDNVFEPTNPSGFTAWIGEKDAITGRSLRKVIRIMKYLRDHKGTFSGTRSIILTTLLGERVAEANVALDPGYYADVPTTLVRVVADLDDWLQARPKRPPIDDPSNSGATFDHRWNDATYRTLRDRIHEYSGDFQDAYDDPDGDSSLTKWQKLFGNEFNPPSGKASSPKFGTVAAATPPRSGRAG